MGNQRFISGECSGDAPAIIAPLRRPADLARGQRKLDSLVRGAKEPDGRDALPDTMNLRVWDAGRPRWVSPFAGASHDERNTGCSKGGLLQRRA